MRINPVKNSRTCFSPATALCSLPLLFVAMLLALTSASCGESPMRRTLRQAEAVMEEHPDSAYSLLTGLEVDSTASEEDRALHALLLVQAMHKTHKLMYGCDKEVVSEADSMMRGALSYFVDGEDEYLKMLAFHYTGVVQSLDSSGYIGALQPLSRGIEISINEKKPLWTARGYDVMGDIFYCGGAYHDMTESLKEAERYYRDAGRPDLEGQARLGVAMGCLNEGSYGEAAKRADAIMRDTDMTLDSVLWTQAADVKARSLYFGGSPREAVALIERLDSMGLHQPELVIFLISGMLQEGDTNGAVEAMKRYGGELSEEDRRIVERMLDRVSGDPRRQLRAMTAMYDTLVADYDRHAVQGFNTVQNRIARNLEDRYSSYRRLHEALDSLFIILACVVVILLCIVAYKLLQGKRRSHEEEIEKWKNEADKIRQTVEEESNKIRKVLADEIEARDVALSAEREEKRKVRIRLDRAECESLSRIISFYYAHGEKEEKRADRDTIAFIKKRINGYALHATRMKGFEKMLDEKYGGIMSEMRKDFPGLKDSYYHVIIYSLLGFDKNAIAYFIGAKKGKAITNIVYRITQMIQLLPEDRQPIYDLFMGKSEKNKENGHKAR